LKTQANSIVVAAPTLVKQSLGVSRQTRGGQHPSATIARFGEKNYGCCFGESGLRTGESGLRRTG
jgi:hypothetical protein